MVAVVFELDFGVHLLRSQLEVLGHFADILLENSLYLMLGKSTDRGKPWEQGNILQVVDSREDCVFF